MEWGASGEAPGNILDSTEAALWPPVAQNTGGGT
jgi:hypothetical protein